MLWIYSIEINIYQSLFIIFHFSSHHVKYRHAFNNIWWSQHSITYLLISSASIGILIFIRTVVPRKRVYYSLRKQQVLFCHVIRCYLLLVVLIKTVNWWFSDCSITMRRTVSSPKSVIKTNYRYRFSKPVRNWVNLITSSRCVVYNYNEIQLVRQKYWPTKLHT